MQADEKTKLNQVSESLEPNWPQKELSTADSFQAEILVGEFGPLEVPKQFQISEKTVRLEYWELHFQRL